LTLLAPRHPPGPSPAATTSDVRAWPTFIVSIVRMEAEA
jgi:hypothetical protein